MLSFGLITLICMSICTIGTIHHSAYDKHKIKISIIPCCIHPSTLWSIIITVLNCTLPYRPTTMLLSKLSSLLSSTLQSINSILPPYALNCPLSVCKTGCYIVNYVDPSKYISKYTFKLISKPALKYTLNGTWCHTSCILGLMLLSTIL